MAKAALAVPGRVTARATARARKVTLLLMDVDGVLSDGRIYYLPKPSGGHMSGPFTPFESKTFHARDGLGIRLFHEAGLRTGIISGRESPVVEYRARELGIHFLRQGARDKLGPYRELLQEAKVPDEEVCFIGDDLVDLPLLIRVGLGIGVGDGHPLLARHVHYVTRSAGGMGAVREAIELILNAQSKLQPVLDHYLDLRR